MAIVCAVVTGASGCTDPDYDAPQSGATVSPDARFKGVGDAELVWWKPGPRSDEIVVQFLGGPCAPLATVTTRQSDQAVAVTARLGHLRGDCLGIGTSLYAVIDLDEPLGTRTVVDAAHGSRPVPRQPEASASASTSPGS